MAFPKTPGKVILIPKNIWDTTLAEKRKQQRKAFDNNKPQEPLKVPPRAEPEQKKFSKPVPYAAPDGPQFRQPPPRKRFGLPKK